MKTLFIIELKITFLRKCSYIYVPPIVVTIEPKIVNKY